MDTIAIEAKNLKKVYHLGEFGRKTAIAELRRRFQGAKEENVPNVLDRDARSGESQQIFALNGVDLTVRKGESLGIIGANGSGKSTLLKVISRITAPTEGTVGINGRIASMLEVGTGFNPAMTGRENIYLNGTILGMTKAEIDQKLEQIIEFSECGPFIDTPVKRYSSGMFVKLAFSVAAHLNGEILLLDEVLAVGDVKFQTKCLDKMLQMSRDENRTILSVSHNMSNIRRLCTRCIVLDHGNKIFDGKTDDAIGVYLGGFQESQLRYKVENVSRPSDSHGKYMRMLDVEFAPNEDYRYRCGDKISFCVTWRSDVDAESMYMRAEMQAADGEPVGVSESNCLGNARSGETYKTWFELPTAELAEGRYYMILDLYTKNEDGSFLTYDRPEVDIPFTIEPNDTGEINWHLIWGHVRLSPMEARTTLLPKGR